MIFRPSSTPPKIRPRPFRSGLELPRETKTRKQRHWCVPQHCIMSLYAIMPTSEAQHVWSVYLLTLADLYDIVIKQVLCTAIDVDDVRAVRYDQWEGAQLGHTPVSLFSRLDLARHLETTSERSWSGFWWCWTGSENHVTMLIHALCHDLLKTLNKCRQQQ